MGPAVDTKNVETRIVDRMGPPSEQRHVLLRHSQVGPRGVPRPSHSITGAHRRTPRCLECEIAIIRILVVAVTLVMLSLSRLGIGDEYNHRTNARYGEALAGMPTGSVYGECGGGKPDVKRLVVNRKEIVAENAPQLGVMLDEFASISKTPFRCPGEMGLRDIPIVEAIYASVRQGGTRVEVTL